MKIAFAVVETPGNSVELYISATEEYPSHEFPSPHANTLMERDVGSSHIRTTNSELGLSGTTTVTVQTQFLIEVPAT